MRFKVGDLVRILPFDEIKSSKKTDVACFGIDKEYIDKCSDEIYEISNVGGSTYSLKDCACYWTDEMLAPAFEEDDIILPDEIELFLGQCKMGG